MDQHYIDGLVANPSESLSVELKGWLRPSVRRDAARILKTCLALRNRGGGFLVLGFSDDGAPLIDGAPNDLEQTYHSDTVQALIARHVSETFEVLVRWGPRDGVMFPVIEVAPGVRTPVAVRSPLTDRDGTPLVQEHEVYVRSLQSNNRPSTTKATWRDWRDLVEVCFDNREADIGRFVRRHLAGVTPDVLRQMIMDLSPATLPPEITPESRATALLKYGRRRFSDVVADRELELPEHGWWDAAVVVDGNGSQYAANEDFLRLLVSSNPRYSGWPMWVDSRPFGDESQPYVFESGWEALVISETMFPKIDFWRLDPRGQFYHRRAHQDDLAADQRIPPLRYLDFGLVILRVAELIAVALKFASAMGYDRETSTAAFALSWQRLKGRQLASWANPNRDIYNNRTCKQESVTTTFVVPLDTPDSAIAPHVAAATAPLFRAFAGAEFNEKVYEDLTAQGLERRR